MSGKGVLVQQGTGSQDLVSRTREKVCTLFGVGEESVVGLSLIFVFL